MSKAYNEAVGVNAVGAFLQALAKKRVAAKERAQTLQDAETEYERKLAVERIKQQADSQEKLLDTRAKLFPLSLPTTTLDYGPDGVVRPSVRPGVPMETLMKNFPGVFPDAAPQPPSGGKTLLHTAPMPKGDEIDPQEARKRVTGNLQTLKSLYEELDKRGAIVNTDLSGTENVSRSVRSSELGQKVAKRMGTEEQSLRNQINQIKPLLINDIRQATKMGAKGLDSEKELEFYLQSATDPKLDIQANLKALNVLDRAYGLGLGIGGIQTPTSTPKSGWTPEQEAQLQADKAKLMELEKGVRK